MRRELIQTTDPTSTVRITCPADHEIRIVGVQFEILGTGSGDYLGVEVRSSSSDTLFQTVSNPVDTTTTAAAAFIGAGTNETIIGAAVQTVGSMPLPDLWFPHDVLIAGFASTGSTANIRVLYERRKISTGFARRGLGGKG